MSGAVMNGAVAGWLQAGLLVVALAVTYRPLGDYMAHVFTSPKHWRVERFLYRVMGVDGDADQRWSTYLRSTLAFSLISVLFLYGFQRLQNHLLLSLGFGPVRAD
jgi:potassium-transporting ATPase potassium-binding subunit